MRKRKLTLINDQVSDFNRKFESKARFLVDESVGMDAVRLIQDRGWNVRYVDDVGLSGDRTKKFWHSPGKSSAFC
jgi:hypothetical protein